MLMLGSFVFLQYLKYFRPDMMATVAQEQGFYSKHFLYFPEESLEFTLFSSEIRLTLKGAAAVCRNDEGGTRNGMMIKDLQGNPEISRKRKVGSQKNRTLEQVSLQCAYVPILIACIDYTVRSPPPFQVLFLATSLGLTDVWTAWEVNFDLDPQNYYDQGLRLDDDDVLQDVERRAQIGWGETPDNGSVLIFSYQ